jgi:hypothetical protein
LSSEKQTLKTYQCLERQRVLRKNLMVCWDNNSKMFHLYIEVNGIEKHKIIDVPFFFNMKFLVRIDWVDMLLLKSYLKRSSIVN